MDGWHVALAGLAVLLGAASWHFWDNWRAADGRVRYWSSRFDRAQNELLEARKRRDQADARYQRLKDEVERRAAQARGARP